MASRFAVSAAMDPDPNAYGYVVQCWLCKEQFEVPAEAVRELSPDDDLILPWHSMMEDVDGDPITCPGTGTPADDV